jgi:predicted methyltransferase
MDIRCLNSVRGNSWQAIQGDCVDVLTQFPDECIDFSIYSPPFGNLFVYSDSAADMGNSTDEEFAEHYSYLVREKFRLTKPGRLTAVHCSDLPMTKWRSGSRIFPAISFERMRKRVGFIIVAVQYGKAP